MSEYVETLLKESKNFCVLPWIHMHAWPTGKIMPCCIADSSKPVAHYAGRETIIQLMNTEDYRNMRISMLKDEAVDICKRCYDLESLGTWTMRQSHNSRADKDTIDLINDTNEDGSIDQFKMKYMDIRFSNLCNMKCRTCGPECSSLHAQEFVEKRQNKSALKAAFNMNSTMITINKDNSFFKEIKPYLNDVTEVYFAGGESLQTQEHYDSLDYWIKNNLTEQVELTYTTNLSTLKFKNKDLLSLWKKFPKIKIFASLDDNGKRAELIRKGTDWDKIEKNILMIKENVPQVEFGISPTISLYNVWTYPKFFEYLMDKKLISENIPPRVNILTHPWWASIQVMPDKIKKKIIPMYQIYRSKYSYNDHIRNSFAVIQFTIMSASPYFGEESKESKEAIKKFIEYNEELDEIRNENILETIPELIEVYEWALS